MIQPVLKIENATLKFDEAPVWSDLNLDVADENVSDVVDPTKAERFISSSSGGALNKGKSNLKVNTMNKITIAGNSAGNPLAEVSSSVKDLLN